MPRSHSTKAYSTRRSHNAPWTCGKKLQKETPSGSVLDPENSRCSSTPAAEKQQQKPCETNGSESEASSIFQPECECQFEGGPSLETLAKECKKNPGHANFIPVKEFLHQEKEKDKMVFFSAIADRTVRVLVDTVSSDRPDVYPDTSNPYPYSHLKGRQDCRRCGTGFVYKIATRKSNGKPCQCLNCQLSGQPQLEYFEIQVWTAVHVVYNTEEAMDTVFECFYDSEDRVGVKRLYGISAWTWPNSDNCIVTCVTHDENLVRKYKSIGSFDLCDFEADYDGVIISHPHGGSKHVTTGRLLHGEHKMKNHKYGRVYRLPKQLSNLFLDDIPGTYFDEDTHNVYYELPKDASWVVEGGNYSGYSPWLIQAVLASKYRKAPPGTKIKLPGGKLVPFPRDAEFHFISSGFQFVYDIPTCPGSSGAVIIWMGNGCKVHMDANHSGSEGNSNISSYGFPYSTRFRGNGWMMA